MAQSRYFPRVDAVQESIGPFPFFSRGVVIINRSDVDYFLTDDSGLEFFCPPSVIATWSGGSTTRFLCGSLLAATNKGRVTVVVTDEATANSTSQLATLTSATGGGTVITTMALASFPPAAPKNGDMVELIVNSTTHWLLRYQASDGYWYFLGGPPLVAAISSGENKNGATYTNLATIGPSIAIPRPGDYIPALGFHGNIANNNGLTRMSFEIGGAAAVDADSVEFTSFATGGSVYNYTAVSRDLPAKTLAAVTCTAKYLTGATGIDTFKLRWMRFTPIRIT